MNLPVVTIARRAKVPLVMQSHGALPVVVNSFFAKRLYDRLLGNQELKEVKVVIVGQESERRQALARGIPSDRIELINNGLDLEQIGQLPEKGSFRKRYQLSKNQSIILFLARINRKKGTDMLIEAFNRINADIDTHLIIAGPDDGHLEEVKRLIEQYSLESRITLTGLLNGEEVYLALQDADLFVLPCRTDTFPMAMVEACAFSIPMVITDRCEIAHLVKGRVAEVVPFDARAFARAMLNVLSDDELYQLYKTNCPKVFKDTFSIQSTVDKLEKLYNRLIINNI
jgi:glycosyltransferase involved in cell wall biosynthesis